MQATFQIGLCGLLLTLISQKTVAREIKHMPVYIEEVTHEQNFEKRGSQCDAKFRKTPGHTACLNVNINANHRVNSQERNIIVDKHNELRRNVKPSATNMQQITWDNEIAEIAQKWASNCKYGHDNRGNTSLRNIPDRFAVGQNIALSYGYKKDWERVIMNWYNEVNHFKYCSGSTNGQWIGHYTQIVWATTNKIGCGYAKCSTGDYYVCNYGPAGNNRNTQNQPYQTPGNSCSSGGQSGQNNGNNGNQGNNNQNTGSHGSSNKNNGNSGGSSGTVCKYRGQTIRLGGSKKMQVPIGGKTYLLTCSCSGNSRRTKTSCS